MQDQERKRYPVGTCTRLKRFTRPRLASAAARHGKSGTGCRDTDLTNHKGRTYTHNGHSFNHPGSRSGTKAEISQVRYAY